MCSVPQEPDQVYEGITFDDFLKVGVRDAVGCGLQRACGEATPQETG